MFFSENIIKDLLKFSSAIGPKITPKTAGAVGYLDIVRKYPKIPAKNIIHKSDKLSLAAYAPKIQTGIINGRRSPLLKENNLMHGFIRAMAIAYIKKLAINKTV